MKVLICGGRNYNDWLSASRAIDALGFKIELIIQGGAAGADSLAKRYAIEKGVHCAEVPPLWGFYGKKAGFLRNKAMLNLSPGYCIAFPGGRGTESMINLCQKAGIPVWRPY
jgi:hypothetical protein